MATEAAPRAATRTARQNPQFVICIRNGDYRASLELRKLYQIIPDEGASKLHQLRVVDESGEDYLYPEDYFVPVSLPHGAGESRAESYSLKRLP